MKQRYLENDSVRWLKGVIGKKIYIVYVLVFLSIVINLLDVLFAFLYKGLVDHAVAGNLDGLKKYVLLFVILILLEAVLTAVSRMLDEYGRVQYENALRAHLFSGILRKQYEDTSSVHSAEWMNLLTSDTMVAANHAIGILPNLAGLVCKLIAVLASLFYLQPGFTLILAAVTAAVLLLQSGFYKKIKVLHKDVQKSQGRMRVFLQECLNSLIMLKVFNRESYAEKENDLLSQEYEEARMRKNRFFVGSNFLFGTGMNVSMIGAAVYCAFGILKGTVSFGTFTSVVQLVTQLKTPYARMSASVPRYYTMLASIERLREAESFRDEEAVCYTETEMRDFYENELQSFDFEHMSFRYQSDDTERTLILNDFNLKVKKGSYLGITGQSGCGKSTFLKLLMSLYPITEGSRFMETAQGRKELNSSYRALFSYVPQGNQLMKGTIRNVVTFGKEDVSDDKVWEAIRIACADTFVKQLPEGLDTELGEQGSGLSEGQLQRIAIARAICSGRPVLLLDEATSSLDEATEARLIRNLKEMTDKTLVIVTHRKAALVITDCVLECTEKEGVPVWNIVRS